MSGWRDPSDPDLPKDGTPFLARITPEGKNDPPLVEIVRWVSDRWSGDGFPLSIGYRNEKSGRWNIRVLTGWQPCPKP